MLRSTAHLLSGAVLAAAFLPGCASNQSVLDRPTTKAQQQELTPDAALKRLEEGNARFRSGKVLHRDVPDDVRSSAAGQYPFAVVLSCMDSRTGPETIFDQGIGDIFGPRIAGNYVQADLLGCLEFATKVSGARLVMVLGHTSCGAIKGACDDVQLGNLTTVIQAIRPSVAAVPGFEGHRDSHNPAFVLAVTEANVRRTVADIRAGSPIIRELEQSGQIRVVGAMYDLDTGEVRVIEQ